MSGSISIVPLNTAKIKAYKDVASHGENGSPHRCGPGTSAVPLIERYKKGGSALLITMSRIATTRGTFWHTLEVASLTPAAMIEQSENTTMNSATMQPSPTESDATLSSNLWEAEADTLIGEEVPPRSPSPSDPDAEGDYSDMYNVYVVKYNCEDGVDRAVAIRKWRKHRDLDAGGGLVSFGDLFRVEDHEGSLCVVRQTDVAYETLQGWCDSHVVAAIDSLSLDMVESVISAVEVVREEGELTSNAWVLKTMDTLHSEGYLFEVEHDDEAAEDQKESNC